MSFGFPLFLCFLLSCSDMFPIAIGIKELMTHKTTPPRNIHACVLFWKGFTRLICKVSLASPCLCASFHPFFKWYPQSNDILLNLSMKCCNSVRNAENSTFNTQGSRVIIVVVQARAVKIYATAVEALRKKRKDRMKLSLPPKLMVFGGGQEKKERQDETQFTTKIDAFLSFNLLPSLNANKCFASFFFKSHLVYDQT